MSSFKNRKLFYLAFNKLRNPLAFNSEYSLGIISAREQMISSEYVLNSPCTLGIQQMTSFQKLKKSLILAKWKKEKMLHLLVRKFWIMTLNSV